MQGYTLYLCNILFPIIYAYFLYYYIIIKYKIRENMSQDLTQVVE